MRVFSIGLFDAATATGSCAIPSTEPAPVGTIAAYSAHPGPTRPVDAACMSPVISGDVMPCVGSAAAPESALPESSEEQADSPRTAIADRLTAAAVIRCFCIGIHHISARTAGFAVAF